MDFDLKIGAVFSLANRKDEKETHQGSREVIDAFDDDYEYLLPDRDDNDDVDVMPGLNRPQTRSAYTYVPLVDRLDLDCTAEQGQHNSNTIPNESTSVVEDPDAPPSLLLENNCFLDFNQPSLISSIESVHPPDLQPEVPLKTEIYPGLKKSCKKIDPCYIVLTNIDPFLKAKTSVSSRSIKRSFVECSNICKKVMFRRHLKAGKDVFNVKTPSKQKDYLIYLLQLEKVRSKRNKKTPIKFPHIRDILEKHDLKVEARKKIIGKPANPRVRRTISRIPKDFANRSMSPVSSDELDENRTDLSANSLSRIQEYYVKNRHIIQLNRLRRQIRAKRALSQNLKRAKRVSRKGDDIFTKSDVTSSVSGRVRKINPKYFGDFALSNKDINAKRLVDVALAQLKRAELANKKREELCNTNISLLQKKRKNVRSAGMTKSVSFAKKFKTAEVVIDNPEEDNVTSFIVNPGQSQKTSNPKQSQKASKSKQSQTDLSRRQDELKDSEKVYIRTPPYSPGFNMIIEKTKKKNTKKNQTKYEDGILIQDMPKEENVLRGVLQNGSFETAVSKASQFIVSKENASHENYETDQFVHTKQLLKDSLNKKKEQTRQLKTYQTLPVKQEVEASDIPTSDQMHGQDKYEKVRIPENGQNLFASRQIKQEPPDTGYDVKSTGSYIPTSHSIVKVNNSNFIYKKILVNLSSSGPAVPTQEPKTVKASTCPVPFTVRYLVPNPALSQAPVARFGPSKNNAPCSTAAAPQSNLTLNTTPILPNTPSVIEQGIQPQIYQQNFPPNWKNVFQSMLPVYAQSFMNTLNANAPLKPAFNAPRFSVNPSLVNAPFTSTVTTNPNTMPTKQTQTVVHKVLPVVHTPSVNNPSVQNQSQTIRQQTVRFSNIVAPGNQTAAKPQTQACNEKCKFYLLKIDGKNVLIPEAGNSQQKAFVFENDVIASASQFSTCNGSNISNIATPTGIRPTLLGLSSVSCNVSQAKPTLGALTNVKHADNILPPQFALASNAVNYAQNKSLFQTVTLSNKGTSTGTVGNTKLVSGVKTSISSTNVTTSMTAASNYTFNNTPKSGSYMLTTQPVNTNSNLQTRNTHPNSLSPMVTTVTVYLNPAGINSSPVVAYPTVMNSLQTTTVSSSAKFPFSVAPLPLVPGNVNQLDKILSANLTQKYLYGNRPVASLLQQKRYEEEVMKVDNKVDKHKDLELCEKSGVLSKVSSDVKTEPQIEEKPKAFKEAVTAREERLRRLKDLLKEKQKAVEDIRSNVPK